MGVDRNLKAVGEVFMGVRIYRRVRKQGHVGCGPNKSPQLVSLRQKETGLINVGHKMKVSYRA